MELSCLCFDVSGSLRCIEGVPLFLLPDKHPQLRWCQDFAAGSRKRCRGHPANEVCGHISEGNSAPKRGSFSGGSYALDCGLLSNCSSFLRAAVNRCLFKRVAARRRGPPPSGSRDFCELSKGSRKQGQAKEPLVELPLGTRRIGEAMNPGPAQQQNSQRDAQPAQELVWLQANVTGLCNIGSVLELKGPDRRQAPGGLPTVRAGGVGKHPAVCLRAGRVGKHPAVCLRSGPRA